MGSWSAFLTQKVKPPFYDEEKAPDFIRGNKLALAAFVLQINKAYPGKLTPTALWNIEAQIHQWFKNK